MERKEGEKGKLGREKENWGKNWGRRRKKVK